MCISVLIKIDIINLMEIVCLSMCAWPGKLWSLLSFNLFYSYRYLLCFPFFPLCPQQSVIFHSKQERTYNQKFTCRDANPTDNLKTHLPVWTKTRVKKERPIVSYSQSFLSIGSKKPLSKGDGWLRNRRINR